MAATPGGIRAVLLNKDFAFYWTGVVFSQIGTRGAVAANLYQIYTSTGSAAQTGLVGAAQALAILVFSPLGGVYADRLDRRRLLQVTQAVAMLVAAALAVVTSAGVAQTWHVLVAALLATTAATFDQPARQALIPAMVPRAQLPQAFALLNPSREIAVLLGPALAGLLIAVSGPGLMYAVDAATYAVLVFLLQLVRVPAMRSSPRVTSLGSELLDGVRFVGGRPIIWMLMSLDLSATVFAAYRVVLPALALDVLHVGATGYGLLSSAPSAGALLATYVVLRVVGTSERLGRTVIVASIAYGLAVAALGNARYVVLALLCGLVVGGLDALCTTIRHAAVQLETPDALRGRVSATYQMGSRGGPAIGDVAVGAFAALVGPALALTIGGSLAAVYAALFLAQPNTVREYTNHRGSGEDEVAPSSA